MPMHSGPRVCAHRQPERFSGATVACSLCRGGVGGPSERWVNGAQHCAVGSRRDDTLSAFGPLRAGRSLRDPVIYKIRLLGTLYHLSYTRSALLAPRPTGSCFKAVRELMSQFGSSLFQV